MQEPTLSPSLKEDINLIESTNVSLEQPVENSTGKKLQQIADVSSLREYELNLDAIKAMKRCKWLSDKGINAGMFLMKQQFSGIWGVK